MAGTRTSTKKDTTTKDDAAETGAELTTDEPKAQKVKTLTTGEVAGAWVRRILEEFPAAYTKKELHELALKGNSKRLNGKQVIEAKKVGQICPANKLGAYTPEGLASDKNGGFETVEDEDGKLSLKK
jgi:hypothetical protein